MDKLDKITNTFIISSVLLGGILMSIGVFTHIFSISNIGFAPIALGVITIAIRILVAIWNS